MVFYYRKDGEWVHQEFEGENNIGVLYDLISSSDSVRFSLNPGLGNFISFSGAGIEDGDFPVFFYPHMQNELTNEEIDERVKAYGAPKHGFLDLREFNGKAEDIVKWVLAISFRGGEPYKIEKSRNWEKLLKVCEVLSNKCSWLGIPEFSNPKLDSPYGFAEFYVCVDKPTVFELIGQTIEAFRECVGASYGVIIESSREDGFAKMNIVFSV